MSDDPLMNRIRTLSEPNVLLDPDVLAKVLEALPDAVVVIDQGRTIRFVNAQTEVLFGYPRQLLLGSLVDMLLPEAIRETHASHIAMFFRAPHSRPMGYGQPLQGRRHDGSIIDADILLGPVVSLHGTYAAAVIRPRRG